jgi:hypothetical protein
MEKNGLPVESSSKGNDKAERQKADEVFLTSFATTFLLK